MKKHSLLTLLFIAFWGSGSCQDVTQGRPDCAYLLMRFLSSDTTKILSRWKLEKNERVDLQGFLKIQSDVYGDFVYPKGLNTSYSYSHRSKESRVSAEFIGAFAHDSLTIFHLNLYKAKKKKSVYMIEDAWISSDSTQANPFLDSLCEPYLKLIANDQVDSLVRYAYDASAYEKAMREIEKIKSEKKRESARRVASYILLMQEIIQSELKSIDPNSAFTLLTSELNLFDTDAKLSLFYSAFNLDGEHIKLKMIFQINKNGYNLTSLGIHRDSVSDWLKQTSEE